MKEKILEFFEELYGDRQDLTNAIVEGSGC